MTEEEPYFGNNMTRQKAHDHLDLLINLLVAEGESAPTFNDQREEGAVGEEGAMVGDGQRQAIYLFQLAVGYISTIIGGETICAAVPWHKGEAPSELRQQLVDMLRLVEPVWGERSEGNAFIYTALAKLDVGETPPLFEASKIGAGKYKWTERRYQFLAVIWAIYLQHGKVNGAEWANNVVAHAFDPAVARETPDAVQVIDPDSGKVTFRVRTH